MEIIQGGSGASEQRYHRDESSVVYEVLTTRGENA
jgi:hypothetical protein